VVSQYGAGGTLTIDDAKRILCQAGYEVCAAFEDQHIVYASSVRTLPGTYGHPAFEVHYNKHSGWLSVSDQPPVCLLNGKKDQ